MEPLADPTVRPLILPLTPYRRALYHDSSLSVPIAAKIVKQLVAKAMITSDLNKLLESADKYASRKVTECMSHAFHCGLFTYDTKA